MGKDQLTELARLGKLMRDAQKAYFRDRTQSNLKNSKEIEALFDKKVREILPPEQSTATQSLF